MISKRLYFLNFIFVVSFRQLFVFYQFEFFLINDVFIDLLLSLVLLFLLQLKLNIFKVVFLLLSFFSQMLNLIFLLLKFFNITQNAVVKFETARWFILLIGLVFVYIYNFSLDNLFSRTLLLWFSFLFKLLFGNVYQVRNVPGWFWIFRSSTCSKSKVTLLHSHFCCGAFLLTALLLVLGGFLLGNRTRIHNILDGWLVNISELEKQLLYLT